MLSMGLWIIRASFIACSKMVCTRAAVAAEQPGEARATMGPLMIKDGRVYDGVTDRALEHAYVVVDGNTITAVGP